MASILAIFKQNLLKQFRDKYEVFWNLAFPLVLMLILILIFGSLSGDGSPAQFNISLLNLEENGNEAGFASIVEEVLQDLDREEDWFTLHQLQEGQSAEDFRENEKMLVEQGDRHVFMVIPSGFDNSVQQAIVTAFSPDQASIEETIITNYRRADSQLSTIAADILNQVVNNINREVNIRSGLIESNQLVEVHHQMVEPVVEAAEPFTYEGYIIPGIILMAFLSSGIEVIVEKLVKNRDKGILRRYFATPLARIEYFAGVLLYIMVLSLIQVLLIYFTARFLFNHQINLLAPLPLFFLFYSLVVFITLGFLVASLARSANSASTIGQAVFFPLMFLGGLFFPVMEMPGLLRFIVIGNPVTYLINGLRDSLGVYSTPTSPLLNIVVPAVWIAVSLIISLKYFSWNPGGRT